MKRIFNRLTSATIRPGDPVRENPIAAVAISAAPALVVIITKALGKSLVRPFASVNVPWSMTCTNMKISGWAFSISSSNSNRCGYDVTRRSAVRLVVADVAGRRTDQADAARAHVFDIKCKTRFQLGRKLLGEFCFATGRSRKQKAHRAFSPKACAVDAPGVIPSRPLDLVQIFFF